MNLNAWLIVLLMSTSGYNLAAQLTPEQKQAKQQGEILYQQGLCEKPAPLLELAAKAGDTEDILPFISLLIFSTWCFKK